MATTDQLITLAERIAGNLRGVSRNEWMRWMQVAQTYGIERAIHYAQRLSQDQTVRPSQQRAYRLTAQAMRRFSNQIKKLGPEDLRKVYGWIAWELVIRRG